MQFKNEAVEENEDVRDKLYSKLGSIIHDCIWNEDLDFKHSGIFIHIEKNELTNCIRAYTLGIDNEEAHAIIMKLAGDMQETLTDRTLN